MQLSGDFSVPATIAKTSICKTVFDSRVYVLCDIISKLTVDGTCPTAAGGRVRKKHLALTWILVLRCICKQLNCGRWQGCS